MAVMEKPLNKVKISIREDGWSTLRLKVISVMNSATKLFYRGSIASVCRAAWHQMKSLFVLMPVLQKAPFLHGLLEIAECLAGFWVIWIYGSPVGCFKTLRPD